MTAPSASTTPTTPTHPAIWDQPLTASEFSSYETKVDGLLELSELQQNGKLDEFVSRFIATPESIALNSYVSAFSTSLKDELRSRFDAILKAPQASGFDETELDRVRYWSTHELEKRRVSVGEITKLTYEGERYSEVSGDSSLDTKTDQPAAEVLVFVNTDHDVFNKRWGWFNYAGLGAAGTYGLYSFATDGGAFEDSAQPDLQYSGRFYSTLKRGESAEFKLGGYYSGHTNPLPDNTDDKVSLEASAKGATLINDRHNLSGSISGNYENKTYAPPAVAGQTTRAYRDISGEAEGGYQLGQFGIIAQGKYSDTIDISAYEQKHTGTAGGSALFKFEPAKQTALTIGLGGERDASESSLTNLSLVEANIQASSEFQWKLPKTVISQTYVRGARVLSSGDLSGWYWELQDTHETLQYSPGRFTFSLTGGMSFYDRELVYSGTEDASSETKSQQELSWYSYGSVQYTPADWIFFKGGGGYGDANQNGYVPVDGTRYGYGGETSLRLSNARAKISMWLKIEGGQEVASSRAQDASYDDTNTYATASLTFR